MATTKDRESLKKKSASFKDAITKNFDDFKANTENVSTAALIGGGVILAGYLLYRLLRTEHSEFENIDSKSVVLVNQPQESAIARSIKGAIATFLLAIAKQKLVEYLNQKEEEQKNA